MPRPTKSHSSPEASLENSEVRTRVSKACQRCRLKKCKCDGTTPCTRCQSDDAICAYEKHKKSDKTVFRSGYVQMLEHQHAQLTAGLHELYRRTQKDGGWTGPQLEAVNHHQPLTHKILEGLGVLQIDEGKGTESGPDTLQDFEGEGWDHSGLMYSETASPFTQAACPSSPTQTAFPQSIIMANRRAKLLNILAPMTEPTIVPPLPMTFAPVKLESHYLTGPDQAPAHLDTSSSSESVNMGLDIGRGSMVDWSYGTEEW